MLPSALMIAKPNRDESEFLELAVSKSSRLLATMIVGTTIGPLGACLFLLATPLEADSNKAVPGRTAEA